MNGFNRRGKRNISNVTPLRPSQRHWWRHKQRDDMKKQEGLQCASSNFFSKVKRKNKSEITRHYTQYNQKTNDETDKIIRMKENWSRARQRGIYLLPNLFTTAALFCGFVAIVQGMNQRFEIAAIAIFMAMVLDGMDGRIARLTHTQSTFGEQYDSLSDMVSFGVAPALVMYEWQLKGLGKLGWLAAFIYCAGAALRLARFNANIAVIDKRFFQGLPSPAAAALIAGFLWLIVDNRVLAGSLSLPWTAFVITLYAGVAMVTSAPFYSGKALDIRHRVPFGMLVLLIIVFVVVSSDPPVVLFSLFVCYALSGFFTWIYQILHRRLPFKS